MFSVDDLTRELKAVGVDFDYRDLVDTLLADYERHGGWSVEYFNGSLYARELMFERYLNIAMTKQGDVLYIDTEPFPRHIVICLLINGHHRTFVEGYVELEDPNRVHISLDDFTRELLAAGVSFHVPEFEGLSHVRYTDIRRHVDFEVSMLRGKFDIVSRIRSHYILSVYTEPHVFSNEEQQAIVDFLVKRYPGLITGFSFYRNFRDVGRWYPGDYMILKVGDVLGFRVILMDAGSSRAITYLYMDGGFRYIGSPFHVAVAGDDDGQLVLSWDGDLHYATFYNREMLFTPTPNDVEFRLTPTRNLGRCQEIDTAAWQRLRQRTLRQILFFFIVVNCIAFAAYRMRRSKCYPKIENALS